MPMEHETRPSLIKTNFVWSTSKCEHHTYTERVPIQVSNMLNMTFQIAKFFVAINTNILQEQEQDYSSNASNLIQSK